MATPVPVLPLCILDQMGACAAARVHFRFYYPNGVPLTKAMAKEVPNKFIDWIGEVMLPYDWEHRKRLKYYFSQREENLRCHHPERSDWFHYETLLEKEYTFQKYYLLVLVRKRLPYILKEWLPPCL